MQEKLYAHRETVRLKNGREIEIPVISNHPEHQEPYRDLRAQGESHEAAEAIADDLWQTRFYDEFVVVADHTGKFIRIPLYSQNKRLQAAYQALRQMGESHNSAVMTVERQGPRIGLCDTTLLKTPLMTHSQFATCDQRRDFYFQKAKDAGVSVGGKFYHPNLATEVGDPEAWVGSISDVRDVCKRRGWDFAIKEGEMKIGIKADLSKNLSDQYSRKHKKKRRKAAA